MLLDKLVAAGIGDRPVVFVTHRFVQELHFFFFKFKNNKLEASSVYLFVLM